MSMCVCVVSSNVCLGMYDDVCVCHRIYVYLFACGNPSLVIRKGGKQLAASYRDNERFQ